MRLLVRGANHTRLISSPPVRYCVFVFKCGTGGARWRPSRFSPRLEEVYCRARPRANQASRVADRIDKVLALFRQLSRLPRAALLFLETIEPGSMHRPAFRRAGAAY